MEAMMAKKTGAKERVVKLFVVLQEGGSSTEGWYAATYDKENDALKAMRGHEKASYNSVGPFEVPEALAKMLLADKKAEMDLLVMLEEMVEAMAGC